MSRGSEDKIELWRAFVDVYRRINRAADRNLESTGMRVQELRVLHGLHRSGPMQMSAIAEEQGLSQPAVTDIIDGLEGKKLVERRRSEEDRRVISVTITESGKEALELGLKRHREFISSILGDLTESEAEGFSSVMEKLRGSVTTPSSTQNAASLTKRE